MNDKQLSTLPELGIHADISNEDYHRGPGISNSALKNIAVSPLYYKTLREHPKPSTDDMKLGTAFHSLTLEPDKFDAEYVLVPKDAPKRPSITQLNAKKPGASTIAAIAFWEKFDADNEGKTPLKNIPGADPFWSPGDWDRIHRMTEAVRAHEVAGILLDPSDGRFEHSIYWKDFITQRLCKCRPDFLNDDHDVIVDLKSAASAGFADFGNAASANKFGYIMQDPFYTDGCRAIKLPHRNFLFVAVEKQPPYHVACYEMDEAGKRAGRMMYEHLMSVYNDCMRDDNWPGYPPLRSLDIPKYGLTRKLY